MRIDAKRHTTLLSLIRSLRKLKTKKQQLPQKGIKSSSRKYFLPILTILEPTKKQQKAALHLKTKLHYALTDRINRPILHTNI